MKNQKFNRVAQRFAMLCACMMALTAAVSAKKINATQDNTKHPVVPIAAVSPEVVKGLEAAAAAAKHTGTNLVFPSSTGTSFAILLSAGAAKATKEDVGRGIDIGVVYIGTGSKELPAGYYYVKMSQPPGEGGGDAGTANPMYDITLTPAHAAGKRHPTGRRQYRPAVFRVDVSRILPPMEDPKDVLDPTALASGILKAIEVQVNKSKSNVRNNN